MISDVLYTFPEESDPHEGTWIQWPHHYQYGKTYRNHLDPTWVALTKELSTSENVHIISYNEEEKGRIVSLLHSASIELDNVDFYIFPTDDFWVRDNGPIYVHDKKGELVIEDWGFNGWGRKAKFSYCNAIPEKVGKIQSRKIISLNKQMILEGGSVEMDGRGTIMACKSSILNKSRNPKMTKKQAEENFTKYLGAINIIWLDGQAGLEITDQHIDGFARFGSSNTIVTMENKDLLEFDVKQSDIDKLYAAKDKDGKAYNFLKLPLTNSNVVTSYGKKLGYKGSYVNYYISNTKVLVPTYNDHNDEKASILLQSLYPEREVVGIDFRNVYAEGGMIHCVTQQQPKESK